MTKLHDIFTSIKYNFYVMFNVIKYLYFAPDNFNYNL